MQSKATKRAPARRANGEACPKVSESTDQVSAAFELFRLKNCEFATLTQQMRRPNGKPVSAPKAAQTKIIKRLQAAINAAEAAQVCDVAKLGLIWYWLSDILSRYDLGRENKPAYTFLFEGQEKLRFAAAHIHARSVEGLDFYQQIMEIIATSPGCDNKTIRMDYEAIVAMNFPFDRTAMRVLEDSLIEQASPD